MNLRVAPFLGAGSSKEGFSSHSTPSSRDHTRFCYRFCHHNAVHPIASEQQDNQRTHKIDDLSAWLCAVTARQQPMKRHQKIEREANGVQPPPSTIAQPLAHPITRRCERKTIEADHTQPNPERAVRPRKGNQKIGYRIGIITIEKQKQCMKPAQCHCQPREHAM